MFYYYGSKRRLAPLYPAPEYRTIVEPFAGAAAYGVYHLVMGSADRLVLVDLDPRVADIWRRVLNMSDDDLDTLEPPIAGERTSDMLHVVVAASNSWSRVKIGMTVTPRMVARWPNMIRNFRRELPFLRGKVEIATGGYQESPNIEATWFVDPPYQVTRDDWWSQGQGYSRSTDFEYSVLARWSLNRRGQVIVAEQSGADWLPFQPLRQSQDSQGSSRKEVMYHSNQEGRS